MGPADRCTIVPAFKKDSPIPDLVMRRLGGMTLLERALATARAAGGQTLCVSDSQEAALAAERACPGLEVLVAPDLAPGDLPRLLRGLAPRFGQAVIIDPACPLLRPRDVELALCALREARADALFATRGESMRAWRPEADLDGHLLPGRHELCLQSRALSIVNLPALAKTAPRCLPWPLGSRGREIGAYEDFWICERLLARRHLIFVVAGYPAIGLGHVYRALMLAHEISSHRVSFVCTSASELAVERIAGRDYPVIRQGREPLWRTVLAQAPDLVVNDLLDTDEGYMQALAAAGVPCVNFEDQGPGARLARLTINALYVHEEPRPGLLQGPDWFCLRDEFAQARRNALRPRAKVVLITFGGTDEANCTLRCLKIIEPIARAYRLELRVVAGPGYAHKNALEAHIAALDNHLVSFTWATNVMSRMMEGCDLCVTAAGRTVYELCHMRVPGLVLAQHEREATHSFARPAHGFYFAGLASRVSDTRIRNIFLALLRQKRRALYWLRQDAQNFTGNKARVIALMQNILEESHAAHGRHSSGPAGLKPPAHEEPALPQGAAHCELGCAAPLPLTPAG